MASDKQKETTMRTIICSLMAVLLFTGCSQAIKEEAEGIYAGHPIIGVWDYDIDGCIESYEFLPDGTRNVKSNEEIVKASYTISEEKSERGFYKLRDEVLQDNGKPDCLGSDSDGTGDVVELYISFNAAEDQFVFCMEENHDGCFGPFRKR